MCGFVAQACLTQGEGEPITNFLIFSWDLVSWDMFKIDQTKVAPPHTHPTNQPTNQPEESQRSKY